MLVGCTMRWVCVYRVFTNELCCVVYKEIHTCVVILQIHVNDRYDSTCSGILEE